MTNIDDFIKNIDIPKLFELYFSGHESEKISFISNVNGNIEYYKINNNTFIVDDFEFYNMKCREFEQHTDMNILNSKYWIKKYGENYKEISIYDRDHPTRKMIINYLVGFALKNDDYIKDLLKSIVIAYEESLKLNGN